MTHPTQAQIIEAATINSWADTRRENEVRNIFILAQHRVVEAARLLQKIAGTTGFNVLDDALSQLDAEFKP